MYSPYQRYETTRYLRDLYGDSPYRRQRRPQTPSRSKLPQILYDSLDNIAKTLHFGNKHNDHINWVPPILPSVTEPKTESYGSNNTHYVIPKVKAVFAGRTAIPKDETGWDKVEEIAKREWNLQQISTVLTRNIDFWREFQVKAQDGSEVHYRQACEIKKTTGCYKYPPVFIRSSKKQLEALLDQTKPAPSQIHPSLYIVGSVDYDKENKQWLITWWFIPVKIKDDFICINTSNFKWKPDTTPNDDGWITRS